MDSLGIDETKSLSIVPPAPLGHLSSLTWAFNYLSFLIKVYVFIGDVNNALQSPDHVLMVLKSL